MTSNKYVINYFLFLFSIIPVSFISGSAVVEFNVILIDLSFIILILFTRNFSFLKSKPILYLYMLYIYLIFNSFISINPPDGLLRNFGFLRFIILFTAINYFFLDKNFCSKVFKVWFLVLFIIAIDVFIEQLSGKNILGFSYGQRISDDGTKVLHGRIVSFFKDEPIVGGFIGGFFLMLVGYSIKKFNKKNFLVTIFLAITFFAAIIISGERSNTIRAFLGLITFIFFIKEIHLKKKIVFIFSVIIIILLIIINNSFLNVRYYSNIKTIFSGHKIYFDLYKSGFHVFENHKIFGVGNKNYRFETCSEKILADVSKKNVYKCNNHPHQIYLELLSEHGLIGTIIILFVLFKLVYSKIIRVYNDSHYLKLGSLIYMIFIFTPLIPSGSFFTSNSLLIFMINLSIFYGVDKKTNIFMEHKYN